MGVISLASIGAVLGASPAAHAADAADLLGATGAGVVAGGTYTDKCQPEFLAAGTSGSGGISYDLQAAGDMASADIVSTDIGCQVWQDGRVLYQMWSGWQRENAAEVTGGFTEYSLDPLKICVNIYGFTTNGTEVSAGWKNSEGNPC
jgi:hypothetical protein